MNKGTIKAFFIIVAMMLVFITGLLAGCGSNEPEARGALQAYLTGIVSGDYTGAYNLISDFDKKEITLEVFIQWRESADKIMDKKGFTIGEKYDRLNGYEYMGTVFEDAYGFDVEFDQEILVDEAEATDYDQDSFKIMVVLEDGDYRIALFLTDLAERTAYYENLFVK